MQRSKSVEVDMTHGPLFVKILLFALPLAASSIFQQLFTTVDVAIAGRYAGSAALAAVGSNTPVVSLFINLFLGISIGANVVVANFIGRRETQRVRSAVGTVIGIGALSGILLLVIGLIVARPLLTVMDTPADVLDDAVFYLRILVLGMPFLMLFNFAAAILRSKGDTSRPLYCLIIAGVVNVALDAYFVIVCQLGVAGVAWATMISHAVSAILVLLILRHEVDPYRLRLRAINLQGDTVKSILRIGVPAGLQGMVFSVSNVCIQGAINGFGSMCVAGSAAAQNFEYYCYFIIAAFNGAAVTFVGQNYGAGEKRRCLRVFGICMAMSLLCCGILNAVITLNSHTFLQLFIGDETVVEWGARRLGTALMFQFMASSYEISGSCLRGLGHSLLPAILTVFGSCVLRLLWIAYILPLRPSFECLLTVYPVSWALTGAMVLTAFVIISRRMLRQRTVEI